MSKSLRKALIWLVIGSFAVPTLLGPSLHLVPGFGHGLGCCGAHHEHAAADLCCAEHDEPASAAASADTSAELADAGRCPICHFLSIGKILVAVHAAPHSARVADTAAAVDRFFIPQSEAHPLGPRGPPLG